MRILLIEDEFLIADAIKASLERQGHHVDWVDDGLSAQDALEADSFDLAILDLGLPNKDGLAVLRDVRSNGNATPILILTAREATENRIEGLDLGADDYLVKPFDMDELIARCRALIRRSNQRANPLLTHDDGEGEIVLDPASQIVRFKQKPIDLSPFAYQTLHALLERKGRIVSKDDLSSILYGWDEEAESNVIEVYISQIRKKTYAGLIRTIRGVGYIIDSKTS